MRARNDWRDEHSEIRGFASSPHGEGFFAANPQKSVLSLDVSFGSFEGLVANGPYLRIGLLTGRSARLYQRTPLGMIDEYWRPGAIAVTLPEMTGECRSSPVTMIGLAIDLDRISHCEECGICVEDLIESAAALHEDALIGSVMTAIRHNAEVHGCSTAFFDQGVAVVLDRLAQLRSRTRERPRVKPLREARLRRVTDLIEARLAGDLSVREMASEAGQDSSGFIRAFREATGCTPFAYLTLRRMERAKQLLAAGLPVTHAALAVGYANPGKFAAAFRRVVHSSPSAWQREMVG